MTTSFNRPMNGTAKESPAFARLRLARAENAKNADACFKSARPSFKRGLIFLMSL